MKKVLKGIAYGFITKLGVFILWSLFLWASPAVVNALPSNPYFTYEHTPYPKLTVTMTPKPAQE